MSDLQHIQSRIAQIRSNLERDPKLVREIEQNSAKDAAFLREAEARMRSRPAPKTSVKNQFSEGDL